jgi:predicted DNA-binding ribbon-helix-helix protein
MRSGGVYLELSLLRRVTQIAPVVSLSVNGRAAEFDAARGEANLSSALRVFVLEWVARNAHLDEAQ